MIVNRLRKTKAPCGGCGMHQDYCFCAEIPKLATRSKLLLVIHYRELRRSSNTGQLGIRSLTNSEMFIKGEGRERLDLSPSLTADYRSVLFYPADDAIPLTAEFVAEDPRPIQLIVADGNWRQASKIQTRHPELAVLPRVTLKADPTTTEFLRKESKPEGMATLEAIAKAFAVIESPEVGEKLMQVFKLKLDRTLKARGQK